MPKPATISPRAPAEAYWRSSWSGISAMPRAARRRLSARTRSAAVSASVPSKSNRTALLGIVGAAQRVIDVAVRAEAVFLRDRVVGHALELERPQPRVAAPARELRGADEARVVVGALRQELEHVLCADHREEVRLRIAVDGREEDAPARLCEPRASRHRARRVRHVLEQLHASDDIEPARVRLCLVFSRNL